jgi:hypothetical protein
VVATWDELLVEDVTAFTARLDTELAVIAGLTPPRRHIYKNGRTLCGDKQYKTGFSPCELALIGDMLNALDKLVHGRDQCVVILEDGNACTMHALDPWHHVGARTDPKYHKFRSAKPLTDDDMQTACDILGLSRCYAGEAKDRVDEKRALRKALVTHESERRRKGLGLATPEYVADIIKAKELGLISEDEAIRRSLGDYNE